MTPSEYREAGYMALLIFICGLALVVMAGAGVQPSGTPLAPWMRIMCAGGGALLAWRMALRAVACFRAARADRRPG